MIDRQVYILDCTETSASPVDVSVVSLSLYNEGARFVVVPWDEASAWRPSPEVVQAFYHVCTGRASDPYDPDDVLREFLSLVPGSQEMRP